MGTPTAYASRYPVTTQPMSAGEASNSARITGRTTLTMEPVKVVRKTADTMTSSRGITSLYGVFGFHDKTSSALEVKGEFGEGRSASPRRRAVQKAAAQLRAK
ncbi:MAG: hypothetical protein CW345_08180 [Firmicutes bacterium]|nr:hypothetical protein [Bacillota bacterium]MBO2521765.1 hypothetical protein [Bacillota bacterium]